MATGLFVGLVTLDLIYLTATLPQPNQKQVALDYSMPPGGLPPMQPSLFNIWQMHRGSWG
jgi:hypothetical protein